MVMVLCEEETLGEANKLVDAIELVAETIEEVIDVEPVDSNEVTCEVDEANKDESLKDRLVRGM
jgi:hypothetical protein